MFPIYYLREGETVYYTKMGNNDIEMEECKVVKKEGKICRTVKTKGKKIRHCYIQCGDLKKIRFDRHRSDVLIDPQFRMWDKCYSCVSEKLKSFQELPSVNENESSVDERPYWDFSFDWQSGTCKRVKTYMSSKQVDELKAIKKVINETTITDLREECKSKYKKDYQIQSCVAKKKKKLNFKHQLEKVKESVFSEDIKQCISRSKKFNVFGRKRGLQETEHQEFGGSRPKPKKKSTKKRRRRTKRTL